LVHFINRKAKTIEGRIARSGPIVQTSALPQCPRTREMRGAAVDARCCQWYWQHTRSGLVYLNEWDASVSFNMYGCTCATVYTSWVCYAVPVPHSPSVTIPWTLTEREHETATPATPVSWRNARLSPMPVAASTPKGRRRPRARVCCQNVAKDTRNLVGGALSAQKHTKRAQRRRQIPPILKPNTCGKRHQKLGGWSAFCVFACMY
jgi:hypothetical protein